LQRILAVGTAAATAALLLYRIREPEYSNNSDGLSRRRRLGEHGNVLASPAATLFLAWYSSGRRLR